MNLDCKKYTKVSVCNGPVCAKKFSKYVYERALAESQNRDSVLVKNCNCCGNCENGVTVKVEKNEKTKFFSEVNPIGIAKIVDHL